jgi:hypothetical protein
MMGNSVCSLWLTLFLTLCPYLRILPISSRQRGSNFYDICLYICSAMCYPMIVYAMPSVAASPQTA